MPFSEAASQPSDPDLLAQLSRAGRDAGLRVAARRPVAPFLSHPAIDTALDAYIEAALDAYEDEVYRGFNRARLNLGQRQRLRSLVFEVLTAALAVPSPSRTAIHPG